MDAYVPLLRRLCSAALLAATTGCQMAAGGPTLPSLLARGQAPDGPKAPDGPLTVTPLPTPAAEAATVPASYSPSGPTPSFADALRERQVRIAAFIGTDTVITDDEVWMMVRQNAPEYANVFGDERAKKEKEVYRRELRKLIERELIVLELFTRLKKNGQEGKTDDLQRFAKEQADKTVSMIRKLNKIPTEEDFARVLRAQGLTDKLFRRQHEREALKNMFLQEMLKDKDKFVTLNDLWDHYTAHPKDYAVEDRVRWLDLFVAFNRFASPDEARRYADAVWQQANDGADFAKLVAERGHGDSNLRHGEGIGQKRGEVQPPELEETIFGMDAGQLSPLLQTATGFHIVKVAERTKAGTKPFDQQVQADIREKLVVQIREREYRRMVDDLWRKYRPKAVEP